MITYIQNASHDIIFNLYFLTLNLCLVSFPNNFSKIPKNTPKNPNYNSWLIWGDSKINNIITTNFASAWFF